jgi:hypothetical protein
LSDTHRQRRESAALSIDDALNLYLLNIVAPAPTPRRMTSGYDAYYRNAIERRVHSIK